MNAESFWIVPLLFTAGTAAGWMDSIAGGGGLITLPVLLSLGLSPADALGTNKLQAVFGSGSAAWHYSRAGLMNLRNAAIGVIFTALGAALGALAVQHVRPDFLRKIIPFLLIAIAAYFLIRPQLGDADVHPRMKNAPFHLLFGLALGFYDGFLGPGTGTFWAMAYVLVLGFNLTKATAHTKLMNFTSNAVSLGVFVFGSHVLIGAGITMGLGELVGARIGSKMVIRRGARLIRPVFIVVALAMSIRLLTQVMERP